MPRFLFGKGHIFNYYNSSGNNYCVRAGADAGVLLENNYFSGVTDPHEFADDTAHIAASCNVYENTTGEQATGGNGTPFATAPYTYALDPAETIAAIVPACAGPR